MSIIISSLFISNYICKAGISLDLNCAQNYASNCTHFNIMGRGSKTQHQVGVLILQLQGLRLTSVDNLKVTFMMHRFTSVALQDSA